MELSKKLKARGFSLADVDTILDSLENEGLQSDARYAQSYVYFRSQRGYGPLRIKLELQERGVSSRLINTYVDFNDQVWLQVACRAYKKKFDTQAAGVTVKEQAKRTRYLHARGFTSDIIKRTLTAFSAAETVCEV